jgi:hypothetical protein
MNISTLYSTRNPEYQLSYRMFNRILIFFRSRNSRRRGSSNYSITSPTPDPIAKEDQQRCRHGLEAPSKVDTILVVNYQMMNSWSSFLVDLSATSWRYSGAFHDSHINRLMTSFIKAWIRDTAGDTHHGTGRQKKRNKFSTLYGKMRTKWITPAIREY